MGSSAGVAVVLPILNQQGFAAVLPHRNIGAPVSTTPFQPKFFTDLENRMITAISELIIPADEKSPGAQEARVNEFIDLMVSEADKKEQEYWRDGLRRLNRKAQASFGKEFLRASEREQIELLEEISQHEKNPHSPEELFFKRIKMRTVQGYYTSEIGIHKDLEYKGNTILHEFKGCTHPTHSSRKEVD